MSETGASCKYNSCSIVIVSYQVYSPPGFFVQFLSDLVIQRQ